MRFKKTTSWVQKVHFLEVPHLPKINPGYGLNNIVHILISNTRNTWHADILVPFLSFADNLLQDKSYYGSKKR